MGQPIEPLTTGTGDFADTGKDESAPDCTPPDVAIVSVAVIGSILSLDPSTAFPSAWLRPRLSLSASGAVNHQASSGYNLNDYCSSFTPVVNASFCVLLDQLSQLPKDRLLSVRLFVRTTSVHRAWAILAAVFTIAFWPNGIVAAQSDTFDPLLKAYPDQLARIEGNILIWRNGTRMPLDDGKGLKTFKDWLADPDVEDMLAVPYPRGGADTPPVRDADPGRARNAAFFNAMYGDCTKGEVTKHLVEIVWLPKSAGQRLKVTAVNGVAERLAAVSRELDELPTRFVSYLAPSAGTYNCRPIAGTSRMSAHGYGIAIDIALRHAHYWRWSKRSADGALPYRNAIPREIVTIFEKHGFIWGGAWYHYDTMHFEYRPELLVRAP